MNLNEEIRMLSEKEAKLKQVSNTLQIAYYLSQVIDQLKTLNSELERRTR